MQIRRGCLLPHRKRCRRYVQQPNRRPRSQRAASPRSRRKRPRSKRRGQVLAGRAPSENNKIRSGAGLRPGQTVLAPGSDLRLSRIVEGRQRTIISAPRWARRKSCSCHYDPARSYASTNCRSNQATYPEVCGKHATLRGDVDRADRKSRYGRNRPSGSMLSGQVFGRGDDRNTTPGYSIDARRIGHARNAPFPAPSVDPGRSLVSLRSTHSAARMDHAWMLGGDGIACSASSAGRRGWVERSETHSGVAA